MKDILEKNAIPIIVQPKELNKILKSLEEKPSLIIIDSQAFGEVSKIIPKNIRLTSFFFFFARYKGFLEIALEGIKEIPKLKENAKILIVEGCSHHRQCEDIGTIKIPKLLEEKMKKKYNFSFCSGNDFPSDLEKYNLIIHCGGCMLNDKEMKFRQNEAVKKNVPFTNYGTALAYLNGLLDILCLHNQ